MLTAGLSGDIFDTRSYERHPLALAIWVLPGKTYIHQSIPSLPEVTVRDRADGFAQLTLDARGDRDHQADQLPLDGRNLLERQLVVPILVGPVAPDEVLEEKGAGQPDVVGIGVGGGDLEKLQ